LRDGELRQLTTDHSLSNALGLKNHSSQIVNCIGGGTVDAYLDLENITDDVKSGDVFMLCSDGLTDMISDEKVKEILIQKPEADMLCEAADNAGGYDNISVIVIKIE
jgi:protein phosphatase